VETRYRMGAFLEFARQEEVPGIHILKWRRRKRPTGHTQKILLKTPSQIVSVTEEKVLRQVHHLVQSLIPQFGDLAIGQTQSNRALSAIPHGEEDGGGVVAVVGGVEARGGGRFRVLRIGSRFGTFGRFERKCFGALDGINAIPADAPHLGPFRDQREVVTIQKSHEAKYAIGLAHGLEAASPSSS